MERKAARFKFDERCAVCALEFGKRCEKGKCWKHKPYKPARVIKHSR